MAEYLIQDSTLTGIADAIRSKTGSSELISVGNMASAIESIESSGMVINNLKELGRYLVTTDFSGGWQDHTSSLDAFLININIPEEYSESAILLTFIFSQEDENFTNLLSGDFDSVTDFVTYAVPSEFSTVVSDGSIPLSTENGGITILRTFATITIDSSSLLSSYYSYHDYPLRYIAINTIPIE